MADRSTKHAPSAKAACSMSDAATAVASRVFAHTARANERQQTHVRRGQLLAHHSKLLVAAQKVRGSCRNGRSCVRKPIACCDQGWRVGPPWDRGNMLHTEWQDSVVLAWRSQRARWSRQAASVATCPWPGRPKPAADWLAYLLAPFGRDLRGGRNDEHALAVADDFATVGHQAQARLCTVIAALPPGMLAG